MNGFSVPVRTVLCGCMQTAWTVQMVSTFALYSVKYLLYACVLSHSSVPILNSNFCIELTVTTNTAHVYTTAGLYIEAGEQVCRCGRQYVMPNSMHGRQYTDMVTFCKVSSVNLKQHMWLKTAGTFKPSTYTQNEWALCSCLSDAVDLLL